ncbi:MAG: uroporphyrinogen-III synthase [Acidimicrobiia bacterium]|nr:uroporphyrinogen-III synthase [Acidimicrobiia bacterium]
MEAATIDGTERRGPLTGYRVGVVAHRGRQEQAEVLRRVGAEPVFGPVVEAVPVAGAEALEASTEETITEAPAVVVLTSAAGVEGWLSAAEELGRDAALRKVLAAARVVVQGRATAAAAIALGLTVEEALSDDVDEAGRSLVALLGDLDGWPVAVQVDDGHLPSLLVEVVRGAGAAGFEVAVPVAGLPADLEPALRLVEDLVQGRVEALTFTAPGEVRNLVALAEKAGAGDELVVALNDEVTVVCLSGACRHAAVSVGIVEAVRPERARVGAMVDALVGHLGQRSRRFELGGVEVTLRGTLAVIDGREVWLADRERALLALLARRPGMVVAKAELLRRVWRSDGIDGADGHAVEVAVGRLRRRLGAAGAGLQTVPRRGYRLVAD